MNFSGNISTSGTLITAGGRVPVLPPINLTLNVNGLHYMSPKELAQDIVEDISHELQYQIDRHACAVGA